MYSYSRIFLGTSKQNKAKEQIFTPLILARAHLNMYHYVQLQYHPLFETSPSCLKAFYEPERKVSEDINLNFHRIYIKNLIVPALGEIIL